MSNDAISRLIVDHRYDRVLASIGTDEKGRVVARCLLADPRPWRIQTLAEHTSLSRASVRSVLKSMQAVGLAMPRETGWQATEFGRGFMLRLRKALYDIAEGRTKRLPEDILEVMRIMNTRPIERPFNIPENGVL